MQEHADQGLLLSIDDQIAREEARRAQLRETNAKLASKIEE